MIRRMMIVSVAVAVAALAIGTAGPSAAMHGGGAGGGHFGGGGAMGGHFGGAAVGGGHFGSGVGMGGMGHPGGFAHFGAARSGAFASHAFAPHAFASGGRHFAAFRPGSFGFRHDRFFRHHVAFRHRFFHDGFAFFGAPYAYAYDDDCYRLVWTRWGWRRAWVCY